MLTAAIWILGVIFSAGVAYATVRATQSQTKTDLNRMGQQMRIQAKKNEARFLAISMILIQFVPEKDRAGVSAAIQSANE